MTNDEFKQLNIGDEVQRTADTPRRAQARYKLAGRIAGDPNGTPFFKAIRNSTGQIFGNVLLFAPEEIEIAPVKARK